MNYHFY